MANWWDNDTPIPDYSNEGYKNTPIGTTASGVGPTQAFLESALKGGTSNLSDYLMSGIGVPFGPNDVSYADRFSQNLAALRSRNASVQSDNPASSLAGNVIGNVYQAIRTGGASLPRQIGTQTLSGAVSNYTGSPESNLETAGVSGAIQGGLTGALGVAGKAGQYVVNRAGIITFIKNLQSKLNDPEALAKIFGPENNFDPPLPTINGQPSVNNLTYPGYNQEVAKDIVQNLKEEPLSYILDPDETHVPFLQDAKKSLIPTAGRVMSDIGSSALDAGVGYTLNNLIGDKVNPVAAGAAGVLAHALISKNSGAADLGRIIGPWAAANYVSSPTAQAISNRFAAPLGAAMTPLVTSGLFNKKQPPNTNNWWENDTPIQ